MNYESGEGAARAARRMWSWEQWTDGTKRTEATDCNGSGLWGWRPDALKGRIRDRSSVVGLPYGSGMSEAFPLVSPCQV